MSYLYGTLSTMEEPFLQTASAPPFPFPDDDMFPDRTAMSDGRFVPDSIYAGFEDVDALPDDWSTFFWSA
jgi:hypothetical protein